MSEEIDIVIKNATIVDGTGQPSYTGSIGVRGERIAAIGNLEEGAAQVIDGSRLVACPGFIDPHNHADLTILSCPHAENLLMQGITTVVGGCCGFSLAPVKDSAASKPYLKRMVGSIGLDLPGNLDCTSFDQWLSCVETTGPAVNYAPLVGVNPIRGSVMAGHLNRSATAGEMREMEQLVDEAMGSGAFGLSVGMDYWPGKSADPDEIIPLARITARYGGYLNPHTRHVNNQWPASDPDDEGYGTYHGPTGEVITGRYHGLLEAVEMSKQADGVRLHIAHIVPAYILPQPHPEFLDRAAALATLEEILDSATRDGLEVTYDVIPWSHGVGGSSPILDTFFNPRLTLPEWWRSLDKPQFAEGLKCRTFRDRVKEVVFSGSFKFGFVHPLTDPYWMDCLRVMHSPDRRYEGKTVGELARAQRPQRRFDVVYNKALETVFDILVDDPAASWAVVLDKRMTDGAISEFLKHPAGMPSSDTLALPLNSKTGGGFVAGAPISYGLYAHYLRKFVKEEGAISLEAGIAKATSQPAKLLGLTDRGVLKKGAYADIVLFNLSEIREAGFEELGRPPAGIRQVLVNGQITFQDGKHTGWRPGKVLRHE